MEVIQTTALPMGLSPAGPRQPSGINGAYSAARGLRRAGVLDTLGVFFDVLLPNIAKGVIIRRPWAVEMAERLDLDRRAVRRMQSLRERHGSGPVMLRVPFRSQAVLLHPSHVQRVLGASPDPFSTASSEKRAALSHFEPKGVLVSQGPEREARRRLNEDVLDHRSPVHRLAERFLPVVDEEAHRLLQTLRDPRLLTWNDFGPAWFRMVRRVVFGDAAADDEQLRTLMDTLRSHGNWAFLSPVRADLRDELHRRICGYLERGEPGSLAALVKARNPTAPMAPEHQVPQWLFAFDPAGMTTFRGLALLASHPEQAGRAREEIQRAPPEHLPLLRATTLEALRLWPTTPMVLRQTTRDTEWDQGVMPAGTGILIFANFFHRDDQTQPYADRFAPELWLDRPPAGSWPLIPFSAGPAVCPARHLVQMLSSAMLSALLQSRDMTLEPASRLDPASRLPGTLNHFSLRFQLSATAARRS